VSTDETFFMRIGYLPIGGNQSIIAGAWTKDKSGGTSSVIR
jgi:hypothetical protein